MADTIGTETVHFVNGEILLERATVADITRPGVDGSATHAKGSRAMESGLESLLDVATWSAGQAKRSDYADLVDTVVTVTRDGVSTTNVKVKELVDFQVLAHSGAAGGENGGAFTVRARWVVERLVF